MTYPTQQEAADLLLEALQLIEDDKMDDAIERLYKSARMGDSEAQWTLANILDDELETPRPDEAVYWYKRAIRSGDATGAFNLAMHYKNRGNFRWYRFWMAKAAQLGDEDAKAECGEF